MSIATVRGLLTLATFVAFIALWVWAWSNKRKPDFDAAAQLPLEEDQPVVLQGHAHDR
jgi:cytochrome c oxidase cbb3-type subunit 4